MSVPKSDECVLESGTPEEAIHKMALGNHQSLLVTEGENIVGISRLIDVFQQLDQELSDKDPHSLQTGNLGN